MKLSTAVEYTSPAFKEVYKLYNFKDEDLLKDYCDFVLHEPVEWMRGFPSSWKSVTMFSKPRAAFHKLMKTQAVLDALGADYCEHVHEIVWKSFKENMESILEKRNGGATQSVDNDRISVESDSLSGESIEELQPVPPVPTLKVNPWPKQLSSAHLENRVEGGLNFKQKYEILLRAMNELLGTEGGGEDENARLRNTVWMLIQELSSL